MTNNPFLGARGGEGRPVAEQPLKSGEVNRFFHVQNSGERERRTFLLSLAKTGSLRGLPFLCAKREGKKPPFSRGEAKFTFLRGNDPQHIKPPFCK